MPPRCVLRYPPCDALAQMLLWTSQLYARWGVRSRGDMPHGAQAGVLMPIAKASARFSAASLSGDKVPMKAVSDDLGILMSASQCMLLACFRPSSTPTGTCVERPSKEEYTGAQMAVEKRESNRICRLTTTKAGYRLGSRAVAFYTRYSSPRLIALLDTRGHLQPQH